MCPSKSLRVISSSPCATRLEDSQWWAIRLQMGHAVQTTRSPHEISNILQANSITRISVGLPRLRLRPLHLQPCRGRGARQHYWQPLFPGWFSSSHRRRQFHADRPRSQRGRRSPVGHLLRRGLSVRPVAVRYAWKDWPDYSLANGAGLPASPFRTDDWPVPVAKK